MNKKKDIVYALGRGSKWENNEIRFSLRSVEKNLKNVGNIYIIGESLKWSRDINIINYADSSHIADTNIIMKILRACEIPELSENFIFASDDQIILREMDINEIKAYHEGDGFKKSPDWLNNTGVWRSRFRATIKQLKEEGRSTFHFDTHIFAPFNKYDFPRIMLKYNLSEGTGFTINTLYFNNLEDPPGELVGSKKLTLYRDRNFKEILDLFKEKDFLGYNDSGLGVNLKYALFKAFPDPSKYEKYEEIQKHQVEILDWLDGDRDYWRGVALYKKFGKNKNMKNLLSFGERPKTREKLEYLLLRIINP